VTAPSFVAPAFVAPSFVIVGDVMTDVVVRIPHLPTPGTDTPATVSSHGGGAGANVAAWLGHRGHRVTMVGRVGDDDLGRAAVESLSRQGVDPRVTTDPHHATGTCIVLVTPDGERTLMPDPGANGQLAPGDLPDDAFQRGGHLHVSGYTLLKEGSRLAGLAALDLARRRGMTTSVDASSTAPIVAASPGHFLDWVRGCDVLLANAEEGALLSGRLDPDDAAEVLTSEFRVVAIKRGADGSVAHDADGARAAVPAIADDVTDTTGAGDAFAAGFLGAWASGRPLGDCLGGGAIVAAQCIARVGGRP
jgi:sugar/nucleoside kinase (ribokinase family)